MAVPESRHPVGPATPNGRRHSNAEWDFPFALPGRWQGKKKIPANTERRQPWVDPDAVDPTRITPRFVRARVPLAEFVAHVKTIADKLFGDQYLWSILGAGRHQMGLVTMGALMGGHVRVGLEDSIYLAKGQLAKSNAEQVTKIRTILNELSLEIDTPDEARKMLACKGRNNVAF